MSFASDYLNKRSLFPGQIKEAPDYETGISVVIPAYSEPDITGVLDSLARCEQPGCKVEVIIVVNAPTGATIESLEANRKCIENIISWKQQNENCFFRLFYFDTGVGPVDGWGVGMARKSGMDEALLRFSETGNENGIILCLDADCTVDPSYFISVYNDFGKNNKAKTCSLYFEHPLSGERYPPQFYDYIALYELHLRYLVRGLIYASFPYSFHTVGSAIAVKALPYMQEGGMNRRQAGEDFYFIQKMVEAGGFVNLNTTAVYPAPRTSFRVPFGTGAAMNKMNAGNELLTYNVLAFKDLKVLFNEVHALYNCSSEEVVKIYNDLPVSVKSFIDTDEWFDRISEIKANSSATSSFVKRFFRWFNMFKVIKFLNHSHREIYYRTEAGEAALQLLRLTGSDFDSSNPKELLDYYRVLDRER